MSNQIAATDTQQFISDLTGGAFAEQVGLALSDVADSVIAVGKKGQVKLTFDLTPEGDLENRRVMVKHKMDYQAPEKFGTRKEDYTRQTPMAVNSNGTVSLHANHTGQLFGDFSKESA